MRPASGFSTLSKIIIGGSLALIVVLVAAVLLRPQPQGPSIAQPMGSAAIGGEFTLTDDSGETFTDEDLKGKASLIYFGYTYCPDVCPYSLQAMKAALGQLSEGEREQFRTVLISVDPERDTVDALHQYVQSEAFPDGLIGLTGTAEQVDAAKAAYKVYSAKVEDEGSSAQYLVDHTSLIFLMGKDGEFVSAFTHQEPPETIAKGLRDYIAAQ